MLNNLKSALSRNFTNALGWKTDRKIIVIESDDWGSIRMPNNKVRETFIKKGYNLGDNPYCKYDTLANSDDLNALFDVLKKHKDLNNNHPKFTFNTVVANPDFQKIENSNFDKYFYEPFTTTLKNYYPKEDVFGLWKEGIDAGLIKPQFHGREHVNVPLWLIELKNNNKPLVDAFNLSFWGIPEESYRPLNLNIQASYDSSKKEHLEFYKNSISEGLELFEKIFGFKSITFIANNYIWSSELNKILYEKGVIGLQGMKYQKLPIKLENKRSKKEVYTGKKNNYGQVHLVRNCIFEPSLFKSNFDNIGKCIKQIEQAFFFNKPAIITSHRLNYIGEISKKNRTVNIRDLKSLLELIQKKWPNVEFLSSDELIDYINK
jgi:hypothetical protein